MVIILALLLVQSGCSGLLGGHQDRRIAQQTEVLTDGTQSFYPYALWIWNGYFRADQSGFALADNPYPDETLTVQESAGRVVLYAQATGVERWELDPEEVSLEEDLRQLVAGETYYEFVVYEVDGEYYGIFNAYDRCAGASGMILAAEDLKYSRLLTMENGTPVFGEPMEDTVLLACDRTHCIAYRDKMYVSIEKETGAQREILADPWWDHGPQYHCFANFYQAGDVFFMAGRQDDNDQYEYSLYACRMDGTGLQLILQEIQ